MAYKLKKDLPGCPKGTRLVKLFGNHCCIAEAGLPVYFHRFSPEFIEKTPEWFKEATAKETKKERKSRERLTKNLINMGG